MAVMVSSGALRCGQCPVASRQHQAGLRDRVGDVLADLDRGDDVVAALQDQGRDRHAGSASRQSLRKVTRANCRATLGSIRQKLAGSSSPSAGRSGLAMITGAMAADQPR